ncbi:MAG: hypothetical protein KIS61_19200 [Candidatus Eremiobacteraeota bacterium]|nr:hypothetical protein [Candidatus Eremiobacteraeota bacterium]
MLFRLLIFALLVGSLVGAYACPSCMQMQPSLAEEFEYATAVAIAEPVKPGGNRYRIVRVLRGKLEPGRVVVAAVSAFRKPVFLATTQSEGSPIWSGQPSSAESGRVVEFAEAVLRLPARKPGTTSHPRRLDFFASYLGDPEKAIADSAYAELAAAPYLQLRGYSRRLGQARLRAWLEAKETPEEYRSLYYTMLSQTAGPSEAAWLKQRALASLRQSPTGSQPALLFAYAQVAGQPALTVIRDKFLSGDLTQRTMAVQSLRVLAAENTRMRPAILPLLHSQLRDVRLAGGLFRDLALWKDWSCADRIYQIMLDKETYSYLRMSALRYLVSCPRADVQARLKKMRSHPPDWCPSWPAPYSPKEVP